MPVLAGFGGFSLSSDQDAHKALYMEAKLGGAVTRVAERSHTISPRSSSLGGPLSASRLADDALWIASRQARDVLGPVGRSDELLVRLLREHPQGDMAAKARAQQVIPPWILLELLQKPRTLISRFSALLSNFREGLAPHRNLVSRIRSWRGKSSRRVVLELSQPVEYRARRVSENVFGVGWPQSLIMKKFEVVRRCRDQGDGCLSRAFIDRPVSEVDRIVAAVETFVLENHFA